MPANQPLKRVLLKLSGESFAASGSFGVDPAELQLIASQVAEAANHAQVAVVVGGGNIIRGAALAKEGLVHRATADHMGMLGTVINGLALREALVHLGRDARCMTAVAIPAVAEPFIRLKAMHHMSQGRVVILAAGTGNPFFTTDTAAALRATELECDAFLKATKVDGVYDDDPQTNPNANRYESLTFAEAIRDRLRVMDMTALAMCEENHIPVIVFDFKQEQAITKAIQGQAVGTRVTV